VPSRYCSGQSENPKSVDEQERHDFVSCDKADETGAGSPSISHVGQITLPPGHHYAVMWGIPDNYAGMTNSMLHRSRAFVELAGTDVTILTYEHRDDYDAVRAHLRERGP
jgi:hypothetical protein